MKKPALNWLPFTDFNVRSCRYHATLKSVTRSPRLSLGNLVDKLNSVNTVLLNKSQHADHDDALKVKMACTRFYFYYSLILTASYESYYDNILLHIMHNTNGRIMRVGSLIHVIFLTKRTQCICLIFPALVVGPNWRTSVSEASLWKGVDILPRYSR